MYYSINRSNRLRSALQANDLDALFIRNLSDVKWLTAFDEVFDNEPAHSMVITADKVWLHTDTRYENACKQAAQGTDIQLDVSSKTSIEFAREVLKTCFASTSCVLGVDTSLSLGEYRLLEKALPDTVRLEETKNIILKLRAVKDELEIKHMQEAQRITDAAFSHMAGFIRAGMTERMVRIELEECLRRTGADELAFSSIVATGVNVANPHAVAGERVLESGHAVLMDFGAKAHGYCSDMTRMVFIGQPNQELAQAYAAIRRANEEVVSLIKPGVTGFALHKHAEDVLQEEGFGNTMGHALGHGVGIDVHELPSLSARNKSALEEGNVITVEPGVYVAQKFGMRLEDFGVITKTGFEVITQSSHDMVII